MTRIADLQDRLRRLAKRREAEGIYTDAAICEEAAEALSRTSAVKVSDSGEPLANEFRRLVSEYHEPDTDGTQVEAWNLIADFAIENADAILSALEPAAPEGQQPVAYRVHAPADEHYGIGPDRLQFHPLAQYDLDNGYRQTPLYTRPSEQAVTEAGERAAEQVMAAHYERPLKAWELTALHEALKAAMEAGR